MHDNSEKMKLLQAIREREAWLAARHLPQEGRLLEVGAGRGYQARYFQQLGLQVDAIDLQDSRHLEYAVFPIQIYDGRHIPFPDGTFDVVFSSNVLEHVFHCEDLLVDMGRVLKDDGVMLHLVPTPSWRIWTSLAHYPWVFSRLLSGTQARGGVQPVSGDVEPKEKRSPLHLLRAGLLPFRHGVRGNWLTEAYYFSRVRWARTFRSVRLQVAVVENTGLFYTGYGIPGASFPMEKRSRLAQWLGSSTVLFVLRKANP